MVLTDISSGKSFAAEQKLRELNKIIFRYVKTAGKKAMEKRLSKNKICTK